MGSKLNYCEESSQNTFYNFLNGDQNSFSLMENQVEQFESYRRNSQALGNKGQHEKGLKATFISHVNLVHTRLSFDRFFFC